METKKARRARIKKEIGRCIRDARVHRGLSQEVLGLDVGMQQSYIGRLERGEVMPGADILLMFAQTLKVPVSSLYGEHTEELTEMVRSILSALSGDKGKK